MLDLAEKIRRIAVEEGVNDAKARNIARDVARRIRDLTKPDQHPDLLIREFEGDVYEVSLKEKDPEKALDAVERHIKGFDHEVTSTRAVQDRFVHRIEPIEDPSDDESSSIVDEFAEKSPEEQARILTELLGKDR